MPLNGEDFSPVKNKNKAVIIIIRSFGQLRHHHILS